MQRGLRVYTVQQGLRVFRGRVCVCLDRLQRGERVLRNLAYAASPERMQRDLSSAGKLHKSAAYRLYRYNSMLGIVFNL